MPTYSQAPVDSYLAFLEEITEYEEKSIEEISAQAATINDEEIALPSYLSSPDQSDHENDLSEEPSIYYVIAFRGDAQYYTARDHTLITQGLLYRWTEHSILTLTTGGGFFTLIMPHKLTQAL